MSVLIFLLILYLILGSDKRRSMAGKVVGAIGAVMAVLTFLAVFFAFPGFAILLGAGLGFLFKKMSDKKKFRKQQEEFSSQSPEYEELRRRWEEQNGHNQQHYQYQSKQQSGQTGQSRQYQNGQARQQYQSGTRSTADTARPYSSILPKSAKKRRKIVADFNKKYDLTLTEEEIKRIVDSSYLSYAWQKEIEDMTREYENIYEWFAADTDWLRIYVHSFAVQTISSDFDLQKNIAVESFDEIMKYAESFEHLTVEERIKKVNEKFFTYFDDTSFMKVYRFMESQGKHYDILKVDLLKNEDELERELNEVKVKYKEV